MTSHGSSACWPTSTASAITSAPHSSWIHFTATDVSRPPEYASTTRLGMTVTIASLVASPGTWLATTRSPVSHRRSCSQPCQAGQLAGNIGSRRALGAHHDHRVVAGDGAEHVGQTGTVERR